MSQTKSPLENRSPLSSAIRSVIAAASLSMPISPAFAACSSNTISATVTENCVLSDGENVTITTTGTIQASATPITISGSNNILVTVDSGGSVLGGTGGTGDAIVVSGGTPSTNVTISNSGTISATSSGIYILSSSDISGGITNSGTISGGGAISLCRPLPIYRVR